MTFNPVPKSPYKRFKPTRKERGKFDVDTRNAIIERDENCCRVCKGQANQIHHVKFKSSGGRGVFTNGMLVCQSCHANIHSTKKETRKWQNIFTEMYGKDYYEDEWD